MKRLICSLIFLANMAFTANSRESNSLQVSVYVLKDCPISKKLMPELKRTFAEFGKKVSFEIVMVDVDQTAEDRALFAKDFGLKFPVKNDALHQKAKLAKVENVPTAVFTRKGKVLYFGRISDSFAGVGKKNATLRRRDLRQAVWETVNGKSVSVPKTPVIGCVF